MLNVTQTGVVMSKTVKRVMTVMMVGLAATLGANAEAHYRIIRGVLKFCDHCFVGDLKAVPNLDQKLAEVEGVARQAQVDIRCLLGGDKIGALVSLRERILMEEERDITSQKKRLATVEVRVTNENEALKAFCPGSSPASFIVQKVPLAEINVYTCDSDPPCSNRVSRWEGLNCALKVDPPPTLDNPPPTGTEMVCERITLDHLD